MSTTRLRLVACVLAIGLAAMPMSASSATTAELPQGSGDVLQFVNDEILRPIESPGHTPLPEDPQGALVGSIEALSTQLAAPREAERILADAQLPDLVAGRLAQALDALSSCTTLSASWVGTMSQGELTQLVSGSSPIPGDTEQRMRACARDVVEAGSRLVSTLQDGTSRNQQAIVIDIWPVIRFDTSLSSNTYEHDYALIVDTDGDDTYDNNAGGNLLDVKRGPAGTPPPPVVGPAQGCQRVIADIAAAECVVASALLIDTAGNDTYGILESPSPFPYDARCTDDLIHRRIVTQGAGLAGVGVLMDTIGSDDYTGRTITQGAGHVGGVGVLVDRGMGDDAYLAIRNGQGFALIGGVGILHDDGINGSGDGGGHNIYDFYMPNGGVLSDTDDCDDVPRFVQGAGNLGGLGILFSGNNEDTYAGPAQAHGYGAGGGTGVLIDFIYWDTYVGGPGRTDQEFEAGPTPDAGIGIFADFSGF